MYMFVARHAELRTCSFVDCYLIIFRHVDLNSINVCSLSVSLSLPPSLPLSLSLSLSLSLLVLYFLAELPLRLNLINKSDCNRIKMVKN